MNPRIYTYKITFEEVPGVWYWGVHAERTYDEIYFGSPSTNRYYWKLYTPVKQILQVFDHTEKGWKQANSLERRLILPDLHNPSCLNESCNGVMSLKVYKQNGVRLHSKKDSNGKSINAVKGGEAGSSVTHSRKDERGRSAHAVKMGLASHAQKSPEGKSLKTLRMLDKRDKEKNEQGKSKTASESAKRGNRPEWMDPNHPELGVRTASHIVGMQKRRGYPHGKQNRVKVSLSVQ